MIAENKKGAGHVIKIVLSCIFIFLPFLFGCIVTFFYNGNIDFSIYSPYHNDEVAHYNAVEAIVEYRGPLGYNGYNGTHARFGKCIWSPLREIGNALFFRVFGGEMSYFVMTNITFLCIANLLFVLLTKPERKSLLLLCLVNVTTYIVGYYMFFHMNECYFYALAIIIAGMLYRLYKGSAGILLKYVVAPMLFLWASFAYIPFAIFLPVYFLIVFPKPIKIKDLFLIVLITAVVGIVAYLSFSLFQAPYPYAITLGTEESTFIQRIKIYVYQFLMLTKIHIKTIATLKPSLIAGIFFSWAVIGMCLVACSIASYKKKISNYIPLCFLTGIFTLYFVALYPMYFYAIGGFWRSIIVLIVFTLYGMCLILPKKQTGLMIILIAIIGLYFIVPLYPDNLTSHDIQTNPMIRNIEERKEIYVQYVKISPEQSAWNNTVLFYQDGMDVVTFLPVGTGINLMFEKRSVIPPEAGYALLENAMESYEDVCRRLENKGFIKTYEEEEYTLYKNRMYILNGQ